MSRQVGIVSVGQTAYESEKTCTVERMIFEAVSDAVDGSPFDMSDIDVMTNAGSDMLDGRSISDCTTMEALGGHVRPSYNIEEDGTMGAYYARMLLRSGKYDTALVVGYGQGSNLSREQFTNMMFEPFFTRDTGITRQSASAIQANAYLDETGVDEELAATVAARNRTNGAHNDLVQTGVEPVEADTAAESAPVAEPVREAYYPPITDGACALILASDTVLEPHDRSVAWIEGAAHSSDEYTLDRTLSRAPSCERAAQEAYDEAGITDPRDATDIAEVTGVTPFQELLLYESLDLCDRGDPETVLDDDELAVNPSGGALAADTIMGTGLTRLAEAALQVRGTAGDRQVSGADRALAHGTTGINLQNNAVFVIGA